MTKFFSLEAGGIMDDIKIDYTKIFKRSRPLPWRVLKQFYIKALFIKNAQIFDDAEQNVVFDYRAVLRTMHNIFNIEPLSKIDLEYGKYAVLDLLNDGYIMRQEEKQNSYVLSMKGYLEGENDVYEIKLPHFSILEMGIRHQLKNEILDYYIEGKFEDVIFKTLKFLEEAVRSKAKLSFDDIGVKLMDKAFNPDGGRLIYPPAQTSAELIGIQNIMRGVISFFKNPSSHRTVEWDDPNTVLQILAFVNYLLDLIDKCELVKSDKKM